MGYINDSGIAKLLTLLKGTSFPASDVFNWAKQRKKPEYTKDEIGLSEVDNTCDMDKPVSVAQKNALDSIYKNSTTYTDTEIGKLINGSPETLNTIYKLADAIKENADIIEILNSSIGKKANEVDLNAHMNDETIHINNVQKERYEEAYINRHLHENKDVLDTITYEMVDCVFNFSSHIENKNKHITYEERELWNTVKNKVEQVDGMGLSANNLTDELKFSYDEAIKKSHTHEHIDLLNSITEEDVKNWNYIYNVPRITNEQIDALFE